VLDDYSSDGSCEWLCDYPRVALRVNEGPSLFEHEGQARQQLLEWTMEGQPDYVLSIDADEFVADGQALRAALVRGKPVFGLRMGEVWGVNYEHLNVRTDGGWRPHVAPIIWKAPARLGGQWRIEPKALSSGREPVAARRMFAQAREPVSDILHFGWANRSARQARYQRYVEADGGKFHASAHLRSIMFPDHRCRLQPREWPVGLVAYRDRIVEATRG
jgi:hypothetical protein